MAITLRKWAALFVVPLCMLAGPAVHAAERVALLIGNNAYATVPLRNAVNDAKDLGETLKELGFKVIVRENAGRKDMIDAIREFGAALDGAKAALFFYAGHAMQFKDRNYLVPVDATMGSEEDVTFFSVEIAQVFDRMEKARTQYNFIILDACRDNPFAGTFKLSTAGLAQINAPSGTLIAYATSPGSVAADGFGRNGIYTKNILLEHQGAGSPGRDHVQARARGRGARDAQIADALGLVVAQGRLRLQFDSPPGPSAGRARAGIGAERRRHAVHRARVLEQRQGFEPARRTSGLHRQVSERQFRRAGEEQPGGAAASARARWRPRRRLPAPPAPAAAAAAAHGPAAGARDGPRGATARRG